MFGRKKVTAANASTRFILETLESSAQLWPTAREEVRPILHETLQDRPHLLEDSWTGYCFALARLAAEMQAVRIILAPPIAASVVDSTLAILKVMEEDNGASSMFVRDIDERWQELVSSGVNPMHSVGLKLYDALELVETVEADGQLVRNPVVWMALSWLPIQMGAGWWKNYLQKNRIV